MLPFDSYREVLGNHARNHDLVKCALLVVAVVILAVMVSA
jgi:hypothetical protein